MNTINNQNRKHPYVPPMVFVHKIMDEGLAAVTITGTGPDIKPGEGPGNGGNPTFPPFPTTGSAKENTHRIFDDEPEWNL